MNFSSNILLKEHHACLLRTQEDESVDFRVFSTSFSYLDIKLLLPYTDLEKTQSLVYKKKILPYQLNTLSPFPHSCFLPKIPLLSCECRGQTGTCQGHLPSASSGVESYEAAAVDLRHTLKGVEGGGGGTSCSRNSFSSVQSLSRVQHFVTPWTAARQASPSITSSQSLLKVMSIELVMPSNHLCHPFLLLPSIFLSIRKSLDS